MHLAGADLERHCLKQLLMHAYGILKGKGPVCHHQHEWEHK